MTTRTARWWAHEDWLAVWLGVATLVIVMAGLRPQLPSFGWKAASDLGKVFSGDNVTKAAVLCAGLLALSLPGARALGLRASRYAAGFVAVFALGFLAQVMAGNGIANRWGLEYVIFGLIIGLLISNTMGTPAWLAEGARTEYFIKTGLVIMGASILFEEILEAGFLGILQSVLVVTVVWWFSYWLARRMKVDDEFAVMLSSAVAICGVSAAIATCGAIQGDRKKLSYVTSIVLIVAVPMMVLQPWLIKTVGIPEVVGGAWLGGTLDTTGSVVAAGSMISEAAMKVGTIVKFSQNVLLGVAAFLLSVWWTMRGREEGVEKPTVRVIWERFPKFVLGFMVASLVFSFIVSPDVAKSVKGPLTGLRNAWFAMAFVSIGLETKFGELMGLEEGRPFLAFLGAQAMNIAWTLALAWLIFGGVLFPAPNF